MSQAARALTGGRCPLQAPSAFVRVRPRRARCGQTSARLVELSCSYVSAPAAVGSRSLRPASPPSGCVGPGVEIALVPITTAGDRDRTKPFGEIGSRGVFVKELEEALLARAHRRRGAFGEGHDVDRRRRARRRRVSRARGSARRALRRRRRLRPGMRIGTASVRRRAQLLALEPELSIEPLRGNIDTRLRKRGERGLDAIVLAACGLDRLGLAAEIGRRFEPDELLARGGTGRARAPGARR